MNNICIYAEVIALARFFLGLLLSPQILNIQLPSPDQWLCLQPGLLQGRGCTCRERGLVGAWGVSTGAGSAVPHNTTLQGSGARAQARAQLLISQPGPCL